MKLLISFFILLYVFNATKCQRNAKNDDMLSNANELINITNDAINQFELQNRSVPVEILRKVHNQVIQCIKEYTANTSVQNMAVVKKKLIQSVIRLALYLRQLGTQIDIEVRKAFLGYRATYLLEQITANQRNNDIKSPIVEQLETEVKGMITLIQSASLQSDVDIIDRELSHIEKRLNAYRIQSAIQNRQIVELEKRVESLAIRLFIAIIRLVSEGRAMLADSLQEEVRNLIDLGVELQKSLPPERVKQIEKLIADAEVRAATDVTRFTNKFII